MNDNGTVFGFVTVSVFGSGKPTPTEPYSIGGLGENVGDSSIPLPLKLTVCGLLVAELFTVSVPVIVPVVDGVNVIPIVHVPFAGILLPAHVSLSIA